MEMCDESREVSRDNAMKVWVVWAAERYDGSEFQVGAVFDMKFCLEAEN